MKCLIVDDEPLAHKVIIEYVKEVEYLEIVAQAYRPLEALRLIKSEAIDLIFLDIQMPKMSGLEMLRLSSPDPLVVITSAYAEYALEGYELNVCDYLLKPFRLNRFIQATKKALNQYRLRNSSSQNRSKVLLIKSDKKLLKIDVDDIQYLESYGNYVKLWKEEECIITARTLSSFENELESNLFFRIHKSFYINKNQISYLEGNSLVMKNNKRLPISKNYKQQFIEFLS